MLLKLMFTLNIEWYSTLPLCDFSCSTWLFTQMLTNVHKQKLYCCCQWLWSMAVVNGCGQWLLSMAVVNGCLQLLFIHSFIPDIYKMPLQETYSEALSVQLRSKRNVLRSLQKEDMLF